MIIDQDQRLRWSCARPAGPAVRRNQSCPPAGARRPPGAGGTGEAREVVLKGGLPIWSPPTNQLQLTPTLREPPWTVKNAPNWYVKSPDHVTWHLIVRKPFQELREFADWIQQHTRKFVIGQHDADEDINQTHCHFMINGCDTTLEGLRKELKKTVKEGRKEYAIMTKTETTRVPYDEWMLAVYVLKGDIDNHKLTNYTHEQVLDIVSAWVTYEILDPSAKITTQYELVKAMLPKNETQRCNVSRRIW